MGNRQIAGFLGVGFAILILSSVPAWAESVFLKYNVHTQLKVGRNGEQNFNASYANYTNPGSGHVVIPAGSEIAILKTSRKEFSFSVTADGKVVDFEFHEPRMGMSVGQYIERITSPAPVSFDGFSEQDRAGIAAGKASPGMTKEGVMSALGYPAAHRTPSLESSTWVYWTNRFKTIAVEFDQQGIVKSLRD